MERGGVSPGKPGGRGHGKKSFYSRQSNKNGFCYPVVLIWVFILDFSRGVSGFS